jgi:hypothetical protein
MKLRWKLLIIVVLLVSLGGLYFLEDKFLGEVVWEPTTVVDNCSDADIEALWDEVFVESSAGITVLKDSGGDCDNYVAYKNTSQTDLFMMFSEFLSIVGKQYHNETSFVYSNVSEGFILDLDTLLDPGSFTQFLEDYLVSNTSSWTVGDNDTAAVKYNEIFDPALAGPLTLQSGDYTYIEATTGLRVLISLQSVGETEAKVVMGSSDILSSSPPTLIKNISDYDFDINSSWNTAFTLADHFQMDVGINVGFVYVGGIPNNNGQLINWTIEGGQVKFDPAQGYNGSLEFVLQAQDSFGTSTNSNYFWVNIVPHVNARPVFAGNIDDIITNRTTTTLITLSNYFSDPEGKTMTYTASGINNTLVNFTGNKAYVKINSNFTNFEKFKFVASDGVSSVSSNMITVYLYNVSGSQGGEDLLGKIVNDSLLLDPDGLSEQGTSEGDGVGKVGFWIMVVSGILLVFLVIGVVIYFSFFNKGPAPVPVANTSVNDYLKKINSVESPGPY